MFIDVHGCSLMFMLVLNPLKSSPSLEETSMDPAWPRPSACGEVVAQLPGLHPVHGGCLGCLCRGSLSAVKTSNHHQTLSSPLFSHYQLSLSLSIIICHYQSLSIIIRHYQSLSIIISHYQLEHHQQSSLSIAPSQIEHHRAIIKHHRTIRKQHEVSNHEQPSFVIRDYSQYY